MKYSPDFLRPMLSTGILKLAELFKSYEFELRIAGGAVRDILMGITPKDFDLATNATPTEMTAIFESNKIRMINSNGLSHGTVTARLDGENYEVTTLRVDEITDGRRAKVRFTEDWEEDAGRRDLTVNSMFMDFEGHVIDYFNGIGDVRNRVVRFVNNPEKRIREDYLRILRYFRFFARISKSCDHVDGTLKAIVDNCEGLANISGERILSELEKLFYGGDPLNLSHVVTCMNNCQLFPYLGLPVQDLTEFYRFYEHYLCHVEDVKFGTFISSLLPTLNDVAVFHLRAKMSNECKHLSEFIVEYRHVFEGIDYKQIHDLLVDRRYPVPKYHHMISQLGLYTGLTEKANRITEWTVPRFSFPVGKLKEMGFKGKQISDVVSKLKDLWKLNYYKMPNDAQIDEIVKSVK